jgi:hypothetical protein
MTPVNGYFFHFKINMNYKRSYLSLLFLFSMLGTFISAGCILYQKLTPNNWHRHIQGVYRDAWLDKEAVIQINDIFFTGNRIVLELEHWRPKGIAPAEVHISVCDRIVGKFIVEESKPFKLSLKGNCHPRKVHIRTINPFVDGQGRVIGVKVKSIEVTSRFGFPIPTFEFFMMLFLPMLALIALIVKLLNIAYLRKVQYVTDDEALNLKNIQLLFYCLPFFLSLVSALLLQRADLADLENIKYVFVLVFLLLLGAYFGLKNCIPSSLKSDTLHQKDELLTHSYQPYILLLGALLIGGALRFYGLDFGLPDKFHPDETPKVNAIMRMKHHHDLNPRYFLHPSLLLYLSYFTSAVYEWVYAVLGIVTPPTDYLLRYSGRTVSAVAGTLSIMFLYLVTSRLYSKKVAALTALIFAVVPLNVTCSRYMKEDSLMLFFILGSVFFTIKALQEKNTRLQLLGGIFGGFAAGTKYSGALVAGFLISAPFLYTFVEQYNALESEKNIFARLRLATKKSLFSIKVNRALCFGFFAVCLIPIIFLITTPYALLDFETFYTGFSNEKKHMIRGHTVTITAWSQYWMYHFWRSIIPGMTLFVTVLSAVAAGFFLYRRKVEDVIVLMLILLFYLPAEWVRAKPAPQPERYIVPCIPFLIIAASELVVTYAAYAQKKVLALFLVFSLISLPLIKSVSLASEIKDDTRIKMGRWMMQHLPKGTKVLIDWQPYGPTFEQGYFDVMNFPSGKMIQTLNPRNLKTTGAQYMVLSSLVYNRFFNQPQTDAVRRSVIRKIFKKIKILHEEHPRSAYGTYGFHNPKLTLFDLKELN